jgi:hypothetical protein
VEQEETGEELLPRRAVQVAEEEAETSCHGRPYLTPAALLLLAAREDASPPITASSAAAPATALELGSTLCFPQLVREGERSWFRSVASAMAWAEQRALHPAPLDPPPPSSAVGRALRRTRLRPASSRPTPAWRTTSAPPSSISPPPNTFG